VPNGEANTTCGGLVIHTNDMNNEMIRCSLLSSRICNPRVNRQYKRRKGLLTIPSNREIPYSRLTKLKRIRCVVFCFSKENGAIVAAHLQMETKLKISSVG